MAARDDNISATGEPDHCVGCGCCTVPRDRRWLSTESAKKIVPYLVSLLSRRLDVLKVNYSTFTLESIVQKLYMCRKCFDVYTTHVNKHNRLYDATGDGIQYIIQHIQHQNCVPSPSLAGQLSPAAADSHSHVETSMSSRNRKRPGTSIASTGVKKSPSVEVSYSDYCHSYNNYTCVYLG